MMKHKWKKRSGEGYIDTCVPVSYTHLTLPTASNV